MTGTVFSFRLSRWEAAGVVVYVALCVAYLHYRAQERQATALYGLGRELNQLNRHLEELRDADPDDDLEFADAGCPCA